MIEVGPTTCNHCGQIAANAPLEYNTLSMDDIKRWNGLHSTYMDHG